MARRTKAEAINELFELFKVAYPERYKEGNLWLVERNYGKQTLEYIDQVIGSTKEEIAAKERLMKVDKYWQNNSELYTAAKKAKDKLFDEAIAYETSHRDNISNQVKEVVELVLGKKYADELLVSLKGNQVEIGAKDIEREGQFQFGCVFDITVDKYFSFKLVKERDYEIRFGYGSMGGFNPLSDEPAHWKYLVKTAVMGVVASNVGLLKFIKENVISCTTGLTTFYQKIEEINKYLNNPFEYSKPEFV